MDNSILIKNVKILSENEILTVDILIEDGYILEIGSNIEVKADKQIEGKELIAIPALFDMHVHFRDPGFTHKEDIYTGIDAAVAGGFSGVACMPNTKPAIDNISTIEYIIKKAKEKNFDVYPVSCITKEMNGMELCDYKELKKYGAIAISDDGKPVKNAEILRQAIISAYENELLLISHCEDMDIIQDGIIHKGKISEILNVSGMDRVSEDIITAREIALAASTNTKIHIAHVSTKGSIELIRDAKARGVNVTCETCPHYFIYNHEKLLTKNANYRMNPPLREEEDRLAVLEAIQDGTIDCIVTDHAPHSKEEKADFIKAPNGVVGLETSFAASLTYLYHTGIIDLKKIIELMSENPRKLLNLEVEQIKVGKKANLALVDLNKKWVVDPEKLHSKSKNTVFSGEEFKGKNIYTIINGKVVYDEKGE
jgi:dihydroorotase